MTIATTTAVHNNEVASINECQYTCDVCGGCIHHAYELKRHRNSMQGKNSKSQQMHSHHNCCGSCGVRLNCQQCSNTAKGKKVGGEFVKCECCQETTSATGNAGSVGETAASFIAGGGTVGTKANADCNTGGVLAGGIIKPGDHPVKCHGIACITKCHKHNGSGIIFLFFFFSCSSNTISFFVFCSLD